MNFLFFTRASFGLTLETLCQPLVKLLGRLAPFQGLQFTGMGGPMGTEDEYDT
jgi:hypothetical protein